MTRKPNVRTPTTITREDLAATITIRTNLSTDRAKECIHLILAGITDALQRGDKVEIRGFGSFRTRPRGPRQGRNPQTGEPVAVPAKRVPYFTPGKQLKEGLVE
jgi:integration host factor subunit beta